MAFLWHPFNHVLFICIRMCSCPHYFFPFCIKDVCITYRWQGISTLMTTFRLRVLHPSCGCPVCGVCVVDVLICTQTRRVASWAFCGIHRGHTVEGKNTHTLNCRIQAMSFGIYMEHVLWEKDTMAGVWIILEQLITFCDLCFPQWHAYNGREHRSSWKSSQMEITPLTHN